MSLSGNSNSQIKDRLDDCSDIFSAFINAINAETCAIMFPFGALFPADRAITLVTFAARGVAKRS